MRQSALAPRSTTIPKRNFFVGIFRRYIMGNDSWGVMPKGELHAHIEWDDEQVEINKVKLDLIKDELAATTEIMRDQFGKLGALIGLLALIAAFRSLGAGSDTVTLKIICAAAIFAVHAQSPRLKVFFRLKKRQDAGVRVGSIKTLWDAYYYTYAWLVRRENTTNTIEILTAWASWLTIVALVFVAV